MSILFTLFDSYDVYLLIILCYLFSFGLCISYNLIKIFFFCIINSQKLKSLISDAVGRKTQFTLQLTFSAHLQWKVVEKVIKLI